VKLINVAGPAHALMQFALSPDGRTLAISAELSHRVFFFDITDRMAPRMVGEVTVEAQPFDPIFTNDGRWLYLGNKAASAITVINVGARRVEKVIRGRGIAQPHGVATSADGRYVFISNNNTGQAHNMAGHEAHAAAPATPPGKGTVVAIDARTHEVVSVIEVGNNASGIGLRTRRP
jgi:DNA-binding beta-propeller fold protein YncE